MQIYQVGGAVRDELLGFEVKDRDWVVVGATPEQMTDLGYKPVGKDFPVFIHPDTGEEYALARTERKTGPGYTGFAFDTSEEITLEQDLERRDITINAIAKDENGNLIDPFNGRRDLEQQGHPPRLGRVCRGPAAGTAGRQVRGAIQFRHCRRDTVPVKGNQRHG